MDASLTDQQRQQLQAYAEALRASPHNLLSPRALDELEERHFPEAIRFAQGLPSQAGRRVLDLGTGGGLPGLVIAIVRKDLDVTLRDATAKKIRFVADTAQNLGVAVETLNGRAEQLGAVHAARFDHVVARAVAPLERLVPWALPFLRVGGVMHAIKGERWADELRRAIPVIQQSHAKIVSTPSDSSTSDGPFVVSIAAHR